jgi:hypothetical protein
MTTYSFLDSVRDSITKLAHRGQGAVTIDEDNAMTYFV